MRGPFSTPITPLPGSLFHADPHETTVKPHPVASNIRAEIDAALHRSRFDPDTITVTTEGGTVTLSGTVPTMADRYVACQTAWNSKATSAVQNDLVVA